MRDRKFVAIDGEGYTVGEEHRYVLLASSLGSYKWDSDGLSSKACFDYLLSLRRQAKWYIFVAFGLNYDANMMLRDFGKEKLEKLWKRHSVLWYSYRIEWIPGKWFSISKDGVVCKIYDVFGFFQASFVNSLKKWDIPVQENMEEMKAARSLFDAGMQDEITAYCLSECESLVRLCDALKSALQSVGLVPSNWIGAGSIASGILKKHSVREHHAYDFDFPKNTTAAILHSYFGGRVELFKQGDFKRLIDYDIRSAYPSQAMHLPNLKGKWKRVNAFDPLSRFSIWFVNWDIPESKVVMPFPFRYRKNIYYPSMGSGWYHYPEVKAAIDIYGQQSICVSHGYVFTPENDTKPFDFVRAEFQHRAKLKADGHPAEKVLKLGLNAIYGKLAQGHGFRGKTPPFQSYYWAGRITSSTRAKLLDVANSAPKQLVMIATDGIFFEEPDPDIVTDEVLGGWEKTVLTDAFIAQPGVYAGWKDGEEIKKSRGFFAKEIDFDAIRKGYADEGPLFTAEYPSTRFVGLGSALGRRSMDTWRSWQAGQRKLSLYPNRKFIGVEGPPTTHCPPSMEGKVSAKYVPKDGELAWTEGLEDFVSGMEQPMKDF